jgi:hypothetical protein
MQRTLAIAGLFVFALGTVRAGDDGFKPLFNGKDLTGWHNVNCAPNTWFVKDNMIITTGKPTGYLRSDKQYENFILEFEWFHAPATKGAVGNSGLFVWGDPLPAVGTGYTRSIEVQVLVNLTYKDKQGNITASSHGDLFSIWGAKCKPDRPHPAGAERCMPSENRAKGEYEWNHYKVVANDGVLKLSVNGKEVSGVSQSNPRKGYLALESEGSECRFKNIKIKELPSTNPKPSEICDVAQGHVCLFTGLDLSGWKADAEQKAWKMSDGVLTGNADAKGAILWSEKAYGEIELVFDWKTNGNATAGLILRDSNAKVKLTSDRKAGAWNRSIVRMMGYRVTVDTNGKMSAERAAPATGSIGLEAAGGTVQFRNLFVRELKAKE